MEKITMEEAAEMSGENEIRQFRYTVPTLKFNGRTSKWSLIISNPENETGFDSVELEGDQEIIILKLRRALISYEKVEGKGLRTYSNEYSLANEKITLFERKKEAKKATMIDSGTVQELRVKYPKLRMKQNLYVLHNKQIVKLGVKGKSLGSLFNYYPEFAGDEHMFQYKTLVKNHEEMDEANVPYYVMDFEKGEKVENIDEVLAKIQEVNSNLGKQDKSFSRPEVEEGEKAAQAMQEGLQTINIDEPPLPEGPPPEENEEDPQIA